MSKHQKQKIDDTTLEIAKDRHGYDAYRGIMFYKGKQVEDVTFFDITHRNACNKFSKYIEKHCEVEI